MTDRRHTPEEWALQIRAAIDAAAADGYEIDIESDHEYGIEINHRLTVTEPGKVPIKIWGYGP